MQEQLYKQLSGNRLLTHSAETKSIAKIDRDIRAHGCLLPKTRLEIVDEEKTQAAEILAAVTKRGCVPREYTLETGELLDEYGYSLRQVLEYGVSDAEEKAASGVIGAAKELERRRAELYVLKAQIMVMPTGTACVEWSAADNSWSEQELEAHGYPGDTHVRLTTRLDHKTFRQYNIILQGSELDVINECRRSIHPNAEPLDSALEVLQHPQIIYFDDGKSSDFIEQIRTDFSGALFSANKPRAILNMLKNSFRKHKDAWEYVNENDDIFNALVDSFELRAGSDPAEWRELADQARGGAWQLLLERYSGKIAKHNKHVTSASVGAAGQRAAAAGAVFIACGGSVSMKSSQPEDISSLDRTGIVETLLRIKGGRGVCQSCDKDGELYGCGAFCEHCNKVWCEEYALTGYQLQPKEILIKKYFAYSRGTLGLFW